MVNLSFRYERLIIFSYAMQFRSGEQIDVNAALYKISKAPNKTIKSYLNLQSNFQKKKISPKFSKRQISFTASISLSRNSYANEKKGNESKVPHRTDF